MSKKLFKYIREPTCYITKGTVLLCTLNEQEPAPRSVRGKYTPEPTRCVTTIPEIHGESRGFFYL